MALGYAAQIEGAHARGNRLNISPKHAMEICREIKGMSVKRAKAFLNNVIAHTEFVEFRRYNKQMPHRSQGKPGRWPIKASGYILKIIENAESNAEQKGFDVEKLRIVHAAAHRGPVYKRRAPKGKIMPSNIQTVHVEVVVREA